MKTITGKMIPVELRQGDTVADLKQTIQAREGTPTDEQSLIFDGKQLKDDTSLAAAGVSHDVTVHVLLNLRRC